MCMWVCVKLLIKIKKDNLGNEKKQTNKQTKTQEFKSLFEWELDLKKFEYTMVPFYKSYNPYTAVLKPYDNYVAM